MRIGIDLDGVCYDFVTDCQKWISRQLGVRPDTLPPVTSWDFFEAWGLTADEFWRHVWNGLAAGRIWVARPPVPGCREALQALRQDGHTIHIGTSRAGAEVETMQWLKTFNVPFDTVTITRDKTVLAVDLFLDDYEGNIAALAAAGVLPVVYHQPWNAHVDAPRVAGWPEFVDYVRALTTERQAA